MCVVGSPFSGRTQLLVSRVLAMGLPTTQSVVLALRRDFKISRPTLAAFLGVGESTLKSWETGQRSPSRAAQRCVWLLNNLLRENKLSDVFQLVTWQAIPLFPDSEKRAVSSSAAI